MVVAAVVVAPLLLLSEELERKAEALPPPQLGPAQREKDRHQRKLQQ